MTRPARYRSLRQFYLADPRRIASRERDVGLWWRSANESPLHRAAWVRDTGELYLVRLGPAADGGGQVEILGRARDSAELERTLGGWRDECPRPDSLTWLRRKAARLDRGEPAEASPERLEVDALA
jgi:hypothetical protein